MIHERFSPTAEQIAAHDDFIRYAQKAIEEGFALARRLHDAIVPLPHANPDGSTVKHGANSTMLNDRETILNTLQYYRRYDEQFYDLTRYHHNHVNNGFVSDERMKTEFKHILNDKQRIVASLMDQLISSAT